MDIKADEEVLNYKISNRQVFNKVMQLLPPGEGSPLLNNSSEVPTHEAYILVLLVILLSIKIVKERVLIKLLMHVLITINNHCC